MKYGILTLMLASLLSGGVLRAQTASTESAEVVGSMYGIIGARSSALGESSVAALGDPSAWNSNPATLAGVRGAGAGYIMGHRGMDVNYISTDWTGAGVWIATPIIKLGVHYVKQDLGEFQQSFENGVLGSRYKVYNQTVTIGLATELAGTIAFGANIQLTSDHLAVAPLIWPGEAKPITASGVYTDIGAIASTQGFMRGRAVRDSAYAGVSIQDIGGRFAYSEISQTSKVAQWVRAGGGYSFIVGDSGSTTLRASLSAEYSHMLNPSPNQNGSYGGVGLEATLFELASLRLGARFTPARQGFSNTPGSWTTYGAGINLPLRRVGLPVPIAVGVDYARLPQTDRDIDAAKAENLLEFRMAYTGDLFGR